ncbi:hypothetical protein MTY_2263 [Moorella thermoacetica Y72]|uniref:Uncharacterized protein n=1 Tax=Moorella thermoacetica Y72 TaxID=1325331 RepID=A0A0S6UIX5_NEOTH|nr:hypothetical protein MTY_2263 [Moorella thermoacetica Y72]
MVRAGRRQLFYHLEGSEAPCPVGQYLAGQVRKTPF